MKKNALKKKWNRDLPNAVIFFALIALLFLAFAVSAAYAQEAASNRDVLIDILVKKGIITQEEAKTIEAEAKAVQEKSEQKVVNEIKTKGLAVPDALKGLSISGLAYIDYSTGQKPLSGNKSKNFNAFDLTRGYLTVQKTITPWLSGRITTDITRISTVAGDNDNGNWETRIKYLYAELRPNDLGYLTNMQLEVGQGHNPWLDFEESINPYRVQGTMAIERAGVFNSADMGLSLRGNIAGKLADAKAVTGNSHYDGRYGSWHIGVFNGGGYHAAEANNNKAIEGRLSIRPLPDMIPGLQVSYFGTFGKGNKDGTAGYEPNYVVNMGMLSLENPLYILTAQYFQTTGNAAGTWTFKRTNGSYDTLKTEGYSFFGRVRLPFITEKLVAFGRYDHFDQDKDNKITNNGAYDLYIAGLSYDIYKKNMVLVDFEFTNYDNDTGLKTKIPSLNNRLGNDYKFQVVYQLSF
ncbi:MAG: hypothetical protein ACUVQV_07760 [Dissulfurimicrobium sp.]|uniref:hypothetical protein n=1 Tax=Dissulfurimicrobium sp. TaxID=2022436 RepID=UPI00404B67D7